MTSPPILVEVVGPPSVEQASGIGRTLQNLLRHDESDQSVEFQQAHLRWPPLSDRFAPLRQLPLGIRQRQPGSIVHFTQIAGCALLLWNPVHPSLVTVHDLGVLVCDEDASMFNRWERALLNLQIRGMLRADHFVCVSRYTAQALMTTLHVPAHRIHVAYHAVDRAFFQPMPDARAALHARYQLDFESEVHHLVYVGNELPRKNLPALFQAMSITRQRGIRLRLLKVGGAGGARWREATIRAIQRAGLDLERDVLLIGRVDDTDLRLFLNAADLFVTPSLMEGFGLPVAEAMACGVPVACSNAAALPEIAGGAAELFDPRDPAAIADSLLNVLRDPARRAQLRDLGLARVAALNADAAANPLRALYTHLAGSVTRPSLPRKDAP